MCNFEAFIGAAVFIHTMGFMWPELEGRGCFHVNVLLVLLAILNT